jgi:CD109 antigen
VGSPGQVFKDFFIELALPYSIVRGEVVTLKVGVYNYMNQANNVTVELQLPEGGMLELVNSSTSTVTTSVDADATASVTFDVRGTATGVANMTVTGRTSAATAGRSDAMQRALNVIAEGVPATTVRNLVLSLNGSTVTENLAVVLPDDLVLGSNTTR